MDLFYNVFMNCLKLQSFGCMNFQWRDRNLSGFIKNVIICVSKLNESLIGLEQHESELMIIEFKSLGELAL